MTDGAAVCFIAVVLYFQTNRLHIEWVATFESDYYQKTWKWDTDANNAVAVQTKQAVFLRETTQVLEPIEIQILLEIYMT